MGACTHVADSTAMVCACWGLCGGGCVDVVACTTLTGALDSDSSVPDCAVEDAASEGVAPFFGVLVIDPCMGCVFSMGNPHVCLNTFSLI